MTIAIITMAGFGRRFQEAGFTVPKYRIDAHGRSLFSWSMLSLAQFIKAGTEFVFIVRRDDDAAAFIQQEAAALKISSFSILELSAPTDGQATTALAAKAVIRNSSNPMLIYNIDTFVHPSALNPTDVRGDGWIPCFNAQGDAWSFAAADSDGKISEVREKKRISPNATIGLYWFSSFRLFEELYEQHYRDPSNVEKGERYVAPVYNTLIRDGRSAYICDVPPAAMFPLGTPQDVSRFLSNRPPSLEG